LFRLVMNCNKAYCLTNRHPLVLLSEQKYLSGIIPG
jgi:hypothetical protein